MSVNASGQVAGYSLKHANVGNDAFRTAANVAINPTTDDLGNLGGDGSLSRRINASGQVVGQADRPFDNSIHHAFRTAPNGKINAAADLGTLGGSNSDAFGINDAGQAVGASETVVGSASQHAFRTTANGVITAASDLGTLGGTQAASHRYQYAGADRRLRFPSGRLGLSRVSYRAEWLGKRFWRRLGGLGGNSYADAINDSGQVVGFIENLNQHAFRTTPNGVITAASDLGTLGG